MKNEGTFVLNAILLSEIFKGQNLVLLKIQSPRTTPSDRTVDLTSKYITLKDI